MKCQSKKFVESESSNITLAVFPHCQKYGVCFRETHPDQQTERKEHMWNKP